MLLVATVVVSGITATKILLWVRTRSHRHSRPRPSVFPHALACRLAFPCPLLNNITKRASVPRIVLYPCACAVCTDTSITHQSPTQHGLFPCGAGYLPLTPSWRRLMPGIQPATLTASVIFFPPAIRDLALATGLRQIDRSTFVATLQARVCMGFCRAYKEAHCVDDETLSLQCLLCCKHVCMYVLLFLVPCSRVDPLGKAQRLGGSRGPSRARAHLAPPQRL